MTIEEYIEQRNVGKDSLEADSIREGYEFAKKECPWISVKDRLPEDGAEVITEIGILSRHYDKWYPVYAGDNGYYPPCAVSTAAAGTQ